jgi:dihydrofolate reductase
MRLVVTEFVTVDGVMEDPGGAEGFEHGGWSMRFFDEEIAKFKLDELLATDALLLGRVTYEGFAAAWPSRTDDAGFADRMNSLPKFVVSTTLNQADWNNSTLIKGNVAEEVSKLKEQPGQDLVVHGSGELVQTLMQHDLVDEYRLMIQPIVLGSGKRLFREGSETSVLRLADTKTFGPGVVVLFYQRAETEEEAPVPS